jgi:hypothetical protein
MAMSSLQRIGSVRMALTSLAEAFGLLMIVPTHRYRENGAAALRTGKIRDRLNCVIYSAGFRSRGTSSK